MKKFYFLAALLMMVLAGCTPYDDSGILDRLDDMQEEINQLKADVEAVQTLLDAVADNASITDVKETADGWSITFSNGDVINLKHGEDGADGKDGEDGADGKDGVDGTSVIESVVVADGYVTFTLSNGQTVTLPLEEGGETPEPDDAVRVTAYHVDGMYYGTSYSDAHNYYMLFSDNGMDEEGWELPNSKYYKVDLYGEEGVTDSEGYISIPVGEYVLDMNDTCAAGTIAVSYCGYFETDANCEFGDMLYYEDATLVVTESGATLTVVIEDVTHVVTYNGEVKIVNPDAGNEGGGSGEVIERELSYGDAVYYGQEYSIGADNFYFTLSDVGFDEDGAAKPNGTYYRFDIYAEVGDGSAIPAGTYNLDLDDTCTPGTFGFYYSSYYVTNEDATDYVDVDYMNDGYLTVYEDGTIYAEVTMMISKATHKISFSGDVTIVDLATGGGDVGGGDDNYEGSYSDYSTLAEDLEVALSAHTLYYTYYGDYYNENRNWSVMLVPNSGLGSEGDYLVLDLLGDASSVQHFEGTYNIEDTLGSWTSVAGYADEDGYLGGSFYYAYDSEGAIASLATFNRGTVTIDELDMGMATLTLDAYDYLDNHITASWTGFMRPESELGSAYAPACAQKRAPKAAAPKTVEKVRLDAKMPLTYKVVR